MQDVVSKVMETLSDGAELRTDITVSLRVPFQQCLTDHTHSSFLSPASREFGAKGMRVQTSS